MDEDFKDKVLSRLDNIEKMLKKLTTSKQCLGGDKLLDNQDLCEILGVTKRTLARYRQLNMITYYMIDGKTYYKASEIENFLQQKGKKPIKI